MLKMRVNRALDEVPTLRTLRDLAYALEMPPRDLENAVRQAEGGYRVFRIPKDDGTHRTICSPKPSLKHAQKQALRWLYRRVRIPRHLHGGLPGRSPQTHAGPHLKKRMVATLDILRFFESTTLGHLSPVFDRLGLREDAARAFRALATRDGNLPQGAPTSPLLANLAFHAVDDRLMRLCRRRDLTYTRYINRYISPFIGAEFTNGDQVNRGFAGIALLLPFLIDTSTWIDWKGDVRIQAVKEIQLTDRLSAFADVQYDTESEWELQFGGEILINKQFSLTGGWHSEYGTGGGIKVRF